MTVQSMEGFQRRIRAPSLPIRPDPTGAYGWLTPFVTAIAAHNADFAQRALFVPRRELHFIALTAALTPAPMGDPDHLAAFGAQYGKLPRRSFFAAMAPATPPAVMNLALRFSGSFWRPATYHRLTTLFDDRQARKTLQHATTISRRMIITLTRLPLGFRSRDVLTSIRDPRQLHSAKFAIDVVRKVRADLDDRAIAASFAKREGRDLEGWVGEHLQRSPFPPPPVPAMMRKGVEALRPLANYDDLARASREFENCIRTYLTPVLLGERYFYRYAPEPGGKGVAIVELRRAPAAGWIAYEALGPENNDLAGADRAAIVTLLKNAGIPSAPQLTLPQGPWFEIY